MKDQLAIELDATAKDLLEVLSSFNGADFNFIPAPGIWSAGQMADHVLQSVSGFAEMLSAKGESAKRPADAMVNELSNIFLDFSTSLKSPEFILPRGEYFEKEKMIDSLKHEFTKVVNAISTIDLNEVGSMQLPGMGALSKLEMIHFVTVHTKRHLHQAKKIQAAA